MRPSARLAAGKATVEPVDSAHSSDCVLKIVLITIKGFCDQGLERWEPSYGRKQPLLLANLRAKHNLWDTTHLWRFCGAAIRSAAMGQRVFPRRAPCREFPDGTNALQPRPNPVRDSTPRLLYGIRHLDSEPGASCTPRNLAAMPHLGDPMGSLFRKSLRWHSEIHLLIDILRYVGLRGVFTSSLSF
jgi:hypothetical protein